VSAAADTGIHKSFGQTLAEGWKAGVERINQGYTPNSPLVKTHQSKAEIAEAARSQDEDAKAKARSADVAAQNETRIRVAEINANARIRTAHIYMQQSGLNSDPVGKQLSDVVKSAEARMKSASDQKIALEKNVLAKPADVARAQADYESAVNEARQAADELNGYAQTHTFNTAPASGGPPGRRVPAPSGNAPPPPNAPKKTTYTKPPSMSQADWQKYLKDTNQVE
jgi:hypothetical protein